MKRLSKFIFLSLSAGLLAGCSTPTVTYHAPAAEPTAHEAPATRAHSRLTLDERSRETDRRFAFVNEVQTNEPPAIQQAGSPKQRELSAVKEGPQKMQAIYTCPMHPEVRSDKPGNCPKCGMKLVKRKEASGAEHNH